MTEQGGVLIGYTMAVKIVSEEVLDDLGIIVRKLKLVPTKVCVSPFLSFPSFPFLFHRAAQQVPGVERDVVQYQYAGWPDHGAPASTLPVRCIIDRIRGERAQQRPVVVHCSAGIGRTGAFCAIQTHVERMRQLAAAGAPRAWLEAFAVDVFWTVVQLRCCRFGMIQQIEQYQFCYSAIIDEARALGLLRLSSFGSLPPPPEAAAAHHASVVCPADKSEPKQQRNEG